MLSPAVRKTRPRLAEIAGLIRSARNARIRATVPFSSAPVSPEYPATSAANIAASRRPIRSALICAGPAGKTATTVSTDDGLAAAIKPLLVFPKRDQNSAKLDRIPTHLNASDRQPA
jgi:hypothetical protein